MPGYSGYYGAVGIFTKVFSVEELGNISVDFSAILKLIIMIAAVMAIERLIGFLLGLPKPENHRARSILTIVQSLLKYVAGLVILCWGLAIIGVNVSTIVASVGIVALIIGFSAESLIADVVTGAFMLFENQYNVGDIVEVDGFRGVVTNIGIRTTSITDPGDNVKIINNSAMRNILNRSNKLSRSVSDICIPYETDLEKLEAEIPALMQSIYEKHPDVMQAAPMYLGVQALADSAVVLPVRSAPAASRTREAMTAASWRLMAPVPSVLDTRPSAAACSQAVSPSAVRP